MTPPICRNSNEPSPVEKATADVMHDLSLAIAHEYRAHGVPLPEAEFRRILALYFERQTVEDWYDLLGVQTKLNLAPEIDGADRSS